MLDRATLWRPGPSSGALLAVILATVAIASPLLLGRALGRAEELDEPPGLDAGAGPTES